MDYTPYSHKSKQMLYELAALNPKTLAVMHGASFNGNCSKALQKELWGNNEAIA